MLLIHIWLDEFWLAAYNIPGAQREAINFTRLFQFHPTSAIVGFILIAGGLIFKKYFSPEPGNPGYFIVLVVGGFIPAISFFPTTRPFINWRAFSLTVFFILLMSMLWEATLAVPYGWWGYQKPQMLGLFIGAWSDLPIEAVCVWIAVSYGTVIIFEVFKLWHASGKSARQAFLGQKQSSPQLST